MNIRFSTRHITSLKSEILDLRSQGKTYNEIVDILHCSKSVISYYCKSYSIKTKLERQTVTRLTHCKHCNKPLTTRKQISFCSQQCGAMHKRIDTYEAWKSLKIAASKHASTVKKYLIYKDGNKCQICGIDKWCDKPFIMIMDHIDGNSDNWSFDYLRLVCSNCDSQLSTYKARNTGKGRHSRRERYKNKQSY